jgi:superfamily II DNA or RNA helicase
MELDIIDFLPKYPNINKLDDVLNPYDNDFYEAIYNKKEFYDQKLDVTEDFPSVRGDLMKIQKIIARFLSSYTLYDVLLLLHEMGSGKTCTSIGVIEKIKDEPNSGFTGALILARGEGLLNNFMNELIFKCTDGRYIPDDYDNLSDLEKVHRKKKSIKDFYKLETFETFAKEIKRSSDENLRKRYDNMVIVIDEVHNLRIQDKTSGLAIYEQFHRFLHVVTNCKILLMSGTPMKDGPEEIASVMNLILPNTKEEQLPTKEDFIEQFLNEEGDGLVSVKSEMIPVLKHSFKGRVSYLKAMRSSVKKIFDGNSLGDLKHFDVSEDYMSDFQTKYYFEASEKDTSEKGVYSFSRQAILFVFPDGSYGPEGFKKYIKKIARKALVVSDDGTKTKMYNYELTKELKSQIRKTEDDTHEQMLERLEVFSSKYAATIRSILDANKNGKSTFVYCEWVRGGGVILFGGILKLFGFTQASGAERTGSNAIKKPRFALITNKTATQKEMKDLVGRFNNPDNLNGKIISVIIGSRVIGEGFSLSNVQVENILTPHWNYSETAQAIARGWRLGSHRDLLETGVTPTLLIYQRVSLPAGGKYRSIDLNMYEISELKDINIKVIERIMRESAIDCSLNYKRNYVTNPAEMRECDYMDCSFECDDIIDIDNPLDLDYSTFQIFYQTDNVKDIINRLVTIFRDTFKLDLNTIIDLFPEYSNFQIITAVRTMINESTQIINKYGFPSYVREENNIFFLVDSLSVVGKFPAVYYTKKPNVKNDNTFFNIIEEMYFKKLPYIVKETCSSQTPDQLRESISRLPIEIQETFIEGAILARKLNNSINTDVRGFIFQYFKNYFGEINNRWVSWMLYDSDNIIRCLNDNDEWVNCDDTYITLLEEQRDKINNNLENNKYGYYGLINKEKNTFCIRDVTSTGELGDKRKKRTGKRCTNWDRKSLTRIMVDIVKAPHPPEFRNGDTIDILWPLIQSNKYLKNLYTDNRKNQLTIDDMKRGLFWASQRVKSTCKELQDWFTKNGLIIDDPTCGEPPSKK